MITIKNLLVDLLYCQQQTQTNMTHALQAIQQPEREDVNHSWIDDIPIFDGKPKFYFD